MENVTAVILGGGRGTRLFPLTKTRSKPAVPIAGNYRLIDVTVSNCINSHIDKIFVLTQFNSASLNQHVSHTYRFDFFSPGFVQVLAAEQTPTSLDWFQGTADALRKVLVHIGNHSNRDILILSGDHLYRMDYGDFVRRHRETEADITIAVKPVSAARAPQFGILRADARGRITEFREKPRGRYLRDMRTNTHLLGLSATEARRRPYLGSMGVYLFKFDLLQDILERNPRMIDLAKELIPSALKRHRVLSFPFDGYWEDIGTIASFYRAHMDLVEPLPLFNLFDEEDPLYTRPSFLPGSKVNEGKVEHAILSDGCIVDRAVIRRSIIGVRSRIGAGTLIEDSLVMGADFYEEPGSGTARMPAVGIGTKCTLRRAIVDKNARIGNGVRLENRRGVVYYDDPDERYYIRDRIIVVPKGAVLPSGFAV